MNVTTKSPGPVCGGCFWSTGTVDGHRVLGVSSMDGARQKGWPFAPPGLKNRRPSK